MLMTISSSSLGTLLLVHDSSPRAYGGVEYSFEGFFEREDSEGLGLFCSPRRVLVGRRFPFITIGLLGACNRSVREIGKVVLVSDPLGSDRSTVVL